MTEKEKKKHYIEIALNALKGICNTQENRILLVWEAEEILNLIQKQQEEIKKYKYLYEKTLSELVQADKKSLDKDKTINKLQTLAGLALKGRPLMISKKAFNELEKTIEIEQSEDIMNNGYIFRAR